MIYPHNAISHVYLYKIKKCGCGCMKVEYPPLKVLMLTQSEECVIHVPHILATVDNVQQIGVYFCFCHLCFTSPVTSNQAMCFLKEELQSETPMKTNARGR